MNSSWENKRYWKLTKTKNLGNEFNPIITNVAYPKSPIINNVDETDLKAYLFRNEFINHVLPILSREQLVDIVCSLMNKIRKV